MKYGHNFTPVELLDEILDFFVKSPYAKGHITDGGIIKALEKEREIKLEATDLLPVLGKLVKDNFIGISMSGSTLIANYSITWEGHFHHLSGGYKEQFLEKERLRNLENRQQQQQISLLTLNRIIAVGTAVAAIYYLIEILKYFKILPCKF